MPAFVSIAIGLPQRSRELTWIKRFLLYRDIVFIYSRKILITIGMYCLVKTNLFRVCNLVDNMFIRRVPVIRYYYSAFSLMGYRIKARNVKIPLSIIYLYALPGDPHFFKTQPRLFTIHGSGPRANEL